MKLTKKKAKALSILKWEYIVENNGSENNLIHFVPEIKELFGNCGYCEYDNQKQRSTHDLVSCILCPIGGRIKKNFHCSNSTHPWSLYEEDYTKETAQAVLDLIKNS